jgi:YidC/Oxa1 family membrane protein insertase
MLLQMPILIALYQTFSLAVGESPESLAAVSDRLYPLPFLHASMPLNAEFLGLHLGQPNSLVLPILVAGSTYVLQKMSMLPATDEKMRAQNSMMNLMMPLIFGYITLTLPSGLGLYYVLSNVIGALLQYMYIGFGPINWKGLLGLNQDAVLPRALEVRQAQMKAFQPLGETDDADDEAEAGNGAKPRSRGPKPSQPEGQSAADRRRRYTSGRRRSRR